jgi:hypothetical protein
MILSRSLILALTVAGGAAVAAVLAARRHARRVEAAATQEMDLQRWENECGPPVPNAVAKPSAGEPAPGRFTR